MEPEKMEPEMKSQDPQTEETNPENPEKTENATLQRHNWVTDLYDKANLSVRQLDIILVVLLALIVALFVIFGKYEGN